MKRSEEFLQGYLSDAFNHKQELINLADSKANILLGLIGVILALFFKFIVDYTSTITLAMSIFLVLIPFVISGSFALWVIYPRTPKVKKNSPLGLGRGDPSIFVEGLSEIPLKEIAKDYNEATQSLSAVVNKKFSYLRYAYLFFVIGVAAKIAIELMLTI